jgi:uncharacterized protein YprB with RNaseH-like and TPR domain
MPSLTERLKALGVKVGVDQAEIPPQTKSYPIEKVIKGGFQSTDFGDAFHSEYIFGKGSLHGIISLNGMVPHGLILRWAGIDQFSGSPDTDIGFLDTETSGLAGGTGTFVFMIGLGFFRKGHFQVTQIFMRDPSEEKALLSAFQADLARVQVLVTFNGKSFDVPILKTRYDINQLVDPLAGVPHIDLLHLARRMWKYRLSNRSLKELENSILQLERSQAEIPGWLVPQMYVDYLRTGDARPLDGVFYHNRMDVVSLAALFIHLSNFLENPIDRPLPENLDIFAAARLFEELGHLELASTLYRSSRVRRLPGDYQSVSLRRNAKIYLRNGEFDAGIELLSIASRENDLESTIELAKVYEHGRLDLKKALKCTQKSLRLLERSDLPVYIKNKKLLELQHRMDRLLHKLKA